MKTYTFRIVVEPDGERWHAYCPALKPFGAATWGTTEEEARTHIQEVVEMVVEELQDDGISIPELPKEDVDVFEGTKVSVITGSLAKR